MSSTAMRESDIRPKPLLDEFFARLKRDADRLAAKHAAFVGVPCVFCADPHSHLAFEKHGFAYRRCASCGSLFVSPRPDNAALIEYTENSEAVAFWSTHFYRETAAARRERMFRPRAAATVDVARTHGLSGVVRAADVGAGYGLFLQELAATAPDWELTAIEPDPRLAAVCREHGFATDERWVEQIADGELAADLVTAFEVIEHVYDPSAFLSACRRLLKPGGVALVTTLTISGFDLQVLGEQSRSITPPQHLNFPSVSSIPLLAARTGFQVIDVSTPGELDVDIVRNVFAERPDAVRDGFARQIVTAPEETRRAFQAFLREHRMSSHLRCVLRRPIESDLRTDLV
jgi:SAM-dependent methyltransferase